MGEEKLSKIDFSRRGMLALSAFALFAGISAPVLAQDTAYPTKPITMVTPFNAGGGTDIVARMLSDRLAKNLDQPIIVENLGGAGGMIGSEKVARSTPDGYTLLVGTAATHGVNAAVTDEMPYDTITDFTPVSMFASAPILVLVNPEVPVANLDELIEMGRQPGNELSFSSAGIGSVGHMAGELFNQRMGTSFLHIPYAGGSPAMVDLIAGVVDITFGTTASAAQYLSTGQLRALAILWPTRSASAPDVATIGELGYDEMAVASWYGIFGPAGMDDAISQRLASEIQAMLADEAFATQLATQGLDPVGSSPEEFTQQVIDEVEMWMPIGAVVREAAAEQ